jgi:hypothetical protein
MACQNGDVEAVKALVELGAVVNQADVGSSCRDVYEMCTLVCLAWMRTIEGRCYGSWKCDRAHDP